MQSNGQLVASSPASHVPFGAPPLQPVPLPLPIPPKHAMHAASLYGAVHCCVSRHWKQPNCVAWSLQLSVPEPEPEPEPDPDPLPLPPQSAAHDPPFSPFDVSHMPLPQTA